MILLPCWSGQVSQTEQCFDNNKIRTVLSRSISECAHCCHSLIGLRSAALSRTHQLFVVFGKFRHKIHVTQPDQSGCECMTMPLGSVSLGLLSKMPMWMLSGPGPNVLFFFGPDQTKRTELQVCKHLQSVYSFHRKSTNKMASSCLHIKPRIGGNIL